MINGETVRASSSCAANRIGKRLDSRASDQALLRRDLSDGPVPRAGRGRAIRRPGPSRPSRQPTQGMGRRGLGCAQQQRVLVTALIVGNRSDDAGCPEYQAASPFTRRRLLQAGTAGIAGLASTVALAGRASASAGRPCQAHHLPASVRRAVASRHIRHEARRARGHSRRVSTDRDGLAGPLRLRASAAVRHGHRRVCAGPIGQPPDEKPQLGDLLQPDRPRSAGRRHPSARHAGAVSGLRQHGRQAQARPSTRPSRRSWRIRTCCATAASRRVSGRAFWARRSTHSSSPRTPTAPIFGSPS